MPKKGVLSKCYRNTASYESPTWSEVGIISDLSVNPSWDKADANTRETRVKRTVKTLLGLEFPCKLQKRPGNANYEAFMNALLTDDVLDLLILDGAKDEDGTRGFRCDCNVNQANEDQALGNVLYEEIALDPAVTDNLPKAVWVDGDTLKYKAPGTDDAFA